MDEYYQNGPLPTWIGWYVEHLPHWFHAATVAGTLALELGLVFMMFFPRRVRLICFFIVTPWEIGVILTANYTFLNYLVLVARISAARRQVPDAVCSRALPPQRTGTSARAALEPADDAPFSILAVSPADAQEAGPAAHESGHPSIKSAPRCRAGPAFYWWITRLSVTAFLLTWIAYDTTAEMIGIPFRSVHLPAQPIMALEPFRIANQYGLFAVMTRGRYEIEFQGSNDGENWTAYEFRNKPQALNEAPRIYAPYQPRFDWNLWFASLGDWRENEMVPITEERLLLGDKDVLALFRRNPFPQLPPRYVRAVLWQYWFTSLDEKRSTGDWWRRESLGLYAPELTMAADGRYAVVEWPDELPPHD